MFENTKYFLPTLRQCWVMVFYILIAGGLGMGFAIAFAGKFFGFNISDLNPVIAYTAPMVPVFLYVIFKGNEIAAKGATDCNKDAVNTELKCVPFNFRTVKNIRPVFLALLVAVATIAAMVITEPVSMLFPMPETIKEIYRKMISEPFWTTISVAIAAPLIEEFLLRGVMLRGMLQHISPHKAILWSAFFFAFIHMNMSQAIGAFVLGIFMGWVYYKTGSLWLTILVHFINNGLSTLFTIMFPKDIEMNLMDLITQHYNITSYIMVYAVSAATLAAVICYLHKKLDNEQESETISIQI